MNEKQALKYLNNWGFKSKAYYEEYVKKEMTDLEFIAPQILNIFKDRITDWVQDYLKNRKNRFVAEVQYPDDVLTKRPERVVEKILEAWERYSNWKKESNSKIGKVKAPIKYDPKKFIYTMDDLIRFRIVCNYLSDVSYIGKRIQSDVSYIENKIRNFDKKCKKIKIEEIDYINTPFPERRVGHRALQFIFKYFSGKRPILFEVQVMTQLQHAWDKKDHHLIYEYVRINLGDKIPTHFKNRMAAMSEVLYVADTVFDSLLNNITNIMGE